MILFFSSDIYFKLFYENLKKSGVSIDFLITESPKPKGRNRKITKNPAHQFASSRKIPVLSPDKITDGFINKIKDMKPEIAVLYAYGKILPKKFLEIFKLGIINIHPSLLPKYRGPSPIQSAILDNSNSIGYSIIKLSNKMDAGDIIYKKEFQLHRDNTFSDIKETLSNDASIKLPEILKKYMSGKLLLTKQEDREATYCELIKKSDGNITASDNAISAYNKYRAFIEWPGTKITTTNPNLIIKKAKLLSGKLKLLEVQLPGKNSIDAKSFKNRYSKLLTELPDFVIM